MHAPKEREPIPLALRLIADMEVMDGWRRHPLAVAGGLALRIARREVE